jgi:hypothetical protein
LFCFLSADALPKKGDDGIFDPYNNEKASAEQPFHLALAYLDDRFQQSVSTELWPFQK